MEGRGGVMVSPQGGHSDDEGGDEGVGHSFYQDLFAASSGRVEGSEAGAFTELLRQNVAEMETANFISFLESEEPAIDLFHGLKTTELSLHSIRTTLKDNVKDVDQMLKAVEDFRDKDRAINDNQHQQIEFKTQLADLLAVLQESAGSVLETVDLTTEEGLKESCIAEEELRATLENVSEINPPFDSMVAVQDRKSELQERKNAFGKRLQKLMHVLIQKEEQKLGQAASRPAQGELTFQSHTVVYKSLLRYSDLINKWLRGMDQRSFATVQHSYSSLMYAAYKRESKDFFSELKRHVSFESRDLSKSFRGRSEAVPRRMPQREAESDAVRTSADSTDSAGKAASGTPQEKIIHLSWTHLALLYSIPSSRSNGVDTHQYLRVASALPFDEAEDTPALQVEAEPDISSAVSRRLPHLSAGRNSARALGNIVNPLSSSSSSLSASPVTPAARSARPAKRSREQSEPVLVHAPKNAAQRSAFDLFSLNLASTERLGFGRSRERSPSDANSESSESSSASASSAALVTPGHRRAPSAAGATPVSSTGKTAGARVIKSLQKGITSAKHITRDLTPAVQIRYTALGTMLAARGFRAGTYRHISLGDYERIRALARQGVVLSEQLLPDHALMLALAYLIPVLQREQTFCETFFGMDQRNSTGRGVLYAMCGELFKHPIEELCALAKGGDKADPLHTLASICSVDQLLSSIIVSKTPGNAFCFCSVRAVARYLVDLFAGFMRDYLVSISEMKIDPERRCGVIQPVLTFPTLVDLFEGVMGEHRIQSVDVAYGEIAGQILKVLRKIPQSGKYRNLICLENFHYFYETLSIRDIPVLQKHVEEARSEMLKVHLPEYVNWMVELPLSKLISFFREIESLLKQGMSMDEVQFQNAYSRQAFLALHKQIGDPKKIAFAMRARCVKHLGSDSVVLSLAWMKMKESMLDRISRLEKFVNNCYAGEKLPFTRDQLQMQLQLVEQAVDARSV